MLRSASALALYCVISTAVQAQECPHNCAGSGTIVGCDDRVRVAQGVNTATRRPWKFIGRFEGMSECSGTLIAPDLVLTAAHCFFNKTPKATTFSLGQAGENQCLRPFGNMPVKRVFLPRDYKHSALPTNKRFDLAVAELASPLPSANVVAAGHVPWTSLRKKFVRSLGYPSMPPDDGFLGAPFRSKFTRFHVLQRFRVKPGGGVGLLRSRIDGTGGQSGSGVFARVGGKPRVVGVLIGSPEHACQAGVNWVTQLTPAVDEHIANLSKPNTIDFWWSRISLPASSFVPPC